MKVIKNKSIDEYLSKYGYSYRKGRVLSIEEQQEKNFNDKHSHYLHKGKKYPIKKDKASLLKKNKKYYYIDDKYYQVPLLSKKGIRNIVLGCIGCAVIGVGAYGGTHIYRLVNTTNAKITKEETKPYVDFISDKEPVIGEEYNCSIQIKSESKEQKFMPAKIAKITTGGVEIHEWYKEPTLTIDSNSSEPENYYTYTISEDRSKGNLYIKKILGPVEIEFDLSNIKSLEKISNPYKTTYYVNETFDPSGFQLLATDVNDVKKTIYDNNSDLTFSIEKGYKFVDSDISNNKEVTAIFANTAIKFNITVLKDDIVSLEISKMPSKLDYLVDETFNPNDIEVEATLKTGTKQKLDSSCLTFSTPNGYTFNDDDITTLPREVTVSCNGIEASNKISINVYDNKKMDIDTLPQLIYKPGEKFSLEGLKMRVSDGSNGRFAVMDNKNPRYELSLDSSIQEGYEFKEEDKGKAMRIVVKHKSKIGSREDYVKEFNVGYPIDCDNQADFEAYINNKNYRAIRLIGNDTYYHYTSNGSTANLKNVLLVGDNSNGKTAKLGCLAGDPQSGYLIDGCFSANTLENYNNGMNITLINLDIDTVIYKDNKYIPLTNDVGSRISVHSGFSGYNNATYKNVNFKNAFQIWGNCNSVSDSEGHNFGSYNNFFDCTFNSPDLTQFSLAEAKEHYSFYNYVSSDLNFKGCTFNAFARAISFDMWNWGLYEVILSDCTFNLSNDTQYAPGDNVMIKLKDDVDNNKSPLILNLINCHYDSYTKKGFDKFQTKTVGKSSAKTKIFENGICKYKDGQFIN